MQTWAWMANSQSMHFSDSKTYIILCNWSYQLKDIDLNILQKNKIKKKKTGGKGRSWDSNSGWWGVEQWAKPLGYFWVRDWSRVRSDMSRQNVVNWIWDWKFQTWDKRADGDDLQQARLVLTSACELEGAGERRGAGVEGDRRAEGQSGGSSNNSSTMAEARVHRKRSMNCSRR